MVKGYADALSRRECESKETLMGLLERFSDEESCEGRLLEEEGLRRLCLPGVRQYVLLEGLRPRAQVAVHEVLAPGERERRDY
ncbi:hypothetical protein [Atopobium sp. oral taxon 416]|uniref:hypothetical protein n=1 Tax=Atopobium sp. oral taxon 416 TaxID=712157 RepID=UPI001BAB938F|nr:hypothetical protein [Atopobium sp. oral taxon 416]QUC03154.1 hypothetical protein J4859_14385 [Atopobium sp. oral taxon 416]